MAKKYTPESCSNCSRSWSRSPGYYPSKKFAEEGVQIIHWRGRDNSFKSKAIPADIDMVILYWDYINHPLMQNVKQEV